MTNFDVLKSEPQFAPFVDVAIAAERIVSIDTDASILNCRRAMEFAVKWMYSVDDSLVLPYQSKLVSLLSTEEFKGIVDADLWRRLDFIRRMGNLAAHDGKKATLDQATLCLENLFLFFDFLFYCYSAHYEEHTFDKSLLTQDAPAPSPSTHAVPSVPPMDFDALLKENAALKAELTERRAAQEPSYVPKPLELSEFKTRKLYIDSMLMDAGWTEGVDWVNEVALAGMPNAAGVGYADYVLYDDAHRPLAVIEAKRSCADVAKGRQQASLYADLLEKKHGVRPVIFLTNGFETRIVDGIYPERKCATIYSKRDLEKWHNLRSMRLGLRAIRVNKNIAGRYYQEAAVKAVCTALDEKKRRRALLVMATGSGKTRTVIELVRVLLQRGWVKHVLFLADRTALITQAKRSFVNLLPDLSCSNLCEKARDFHAHAIFSTYQTMISLIDEARDDAGKVFSSGHFDLVIADEAHRSIYNRYRDIFTYFDAPLVGLTATPKDEIDKNTYRIFDLESGVPTYGYELAQAVKDGFLVDFMSVETSLKFIEEGISYDELSADDKAAFEETFADEHGKLPQCIASSALNTWLFNADTIRKALSILMREGLTVDYGQKLGKTIIFAKNHKHAEKILAVFHKEYAHLPNDFAKVIDNQIQYAQSAIDEFSEREKLPQIAISVDMLDTGIDIPEILNLVFFKKVMSKAKFWQMIGRGTRLCPALLDGEDKRIFYIFDFCGNFEFFRMRQGKAAPNVLPLQGAIFNLTFEIVYKLQDVAYQTEELKAFRARLVGELAASVAALPKEHFTVRQHLKYVELYRKEEAYTALTYEDVLTAAEELAPLMLPHEDAVSAVRFDALLYGIELAYLVGKTYAKARTDLKKRVAGIATVTTIPEVAEKSALIDKILRTDYIDTAGINEFEQIRTALRDLMKYLPKTSMRYDTDFTDDILKMELHESALESDDLRNYKAKAECYIRAHQDHAVIQKLKTNQPLFPADVKTLEAILWEEVGSKAEYDKECGTTPLGEFVRTIVGLDMQAAKEAFSSYLSEQMLDERQIYFVNQIIEYIVQNGMMKDLSVLQGAPFTDHGSISEIFRDINLWRGIRKTIENINANANVA